jgi:Uma2 family endonuclease
MVAGAKIRVTFAEYAALPETNQIVELIDGEIVRETVINLAPYAHRETLAKVKTFLVNELTIGLLYNPPSGLHFEDGNSFEPDLFWISPENDQCFLEDDGRYWHGAPDLVIEILSPSTASNDRGSKFDTYEKNGVREYWMVDPDAKFVEVYRHDGSRFERQGVFKPDQPFISAVLGGATIASQNWYIE